MKTLQELLEAHEKKLMELIESAVCKHNHSRSPRFRGNRDARGRPH